MRLWGLGILLSIICLLGGAPAAHADKRLAPVIGNQAYSTAILRRRVLLSTDRSDQLTAWTSAKL